MDEIQLKIEDLRIAFRQGTKAMPAVDAVSLELRKGEMLALLGESGSGKSLTALSLLGLLPHPAAQLLGGHAWFDGQDLYMLPEAELRKIRGHRIAMVFQEPMTALNPLMTVGDQLGEVLRTHFEMHGGAIAKRCVELLDEVEIPEAASRLKSYPHELSGGLRQRVMIAMALAGEPEILIADEPTTALDVTVQAQIMRLLTRLQEKHGTAILFITHNLALAAQGAQRCAVMYAGEIVETATAEELFRSPRHPYTRLLLHSLPR
ncbi:MAG: ABC transporter ATP-binding protein, partial [Victivallales bacterium]|nr:ABC transporter ATP-binding protein [Victivallales bacterium]